MSSLGKRLDDLDDRLSPTDIFLRELQVMTRMTSFHEYFSSLMHVPKSDWPLNRMTRQARRSVEKSMKGMPSDAIEERVHDAERHVAFLWKLRYRVNDCIRQELRVARHTIDLLKSELRCLLFDYELSDATSFFAYPLDPRTAAAVEAALANQVRSWASLGDPTTFREWTSREFQPKEDDDESQARASRKLEDELKRLVCSKELATGKLVSLAALPIPFLRDAPLLEGRWIDSTVLELAEFGVILKDRGWTPQGSGDSHPLALEEFVRADAEEEFSSIDDAAWHDARQAATDRVRAYRGRRRAFKRRDYVNLAPYRKWRAGIVGARLEASTETGFVVPSWNDWVKNRGPNAALSGCWVGPIHPLEDPEVWSVHDSQTAHRLQTYRTMRLADLHYLALGGSFSTQEEARIRWRRLAEDAITMVEGVAATAESIRNAHFRGHEILDTEETETLDRLRADLRKVVRSFNGLCEKRDPLQTYFDDRGCPQDRQTAYSPHERDAIERIEKSIQQLGERLAHDVIPKVRYDALDSVGDRDAANTLGDQQLDKFLSEGKDGAR